MSMHRWYESKSERFEVECRLLRDRYPEGKVVKLDGLIRFWIGVRGRDALYQCELVYPERFPYQHIVARIRSPQLRSSPHRYGADKPCLHHPEDVGPETTGVVFVGWLKEWIRRYERYQNTSHWED
jgi:hypothetical protein